MPKSTCIVYLFIFCENVLFIEVHHMLQARHFGKSFNRLGCAATIILLTVASFETVARNFTRSLAPINIDCRIVLA